MLRPTHLLPPQRLLTPRSARGISSASSGPATGRSDHLPGRDLHPLVRCSFVTHVPRIPRIPFPIPWPKDSAQLDPTSPTDISTLLETGHLYFALTMTRLPKTPFVRAMLDLGRHGPHPLERTQDKPSGRLLPMQPGWRPLLRAAFEQRPFPRPRPECAGAFVSLRDHHL